MDQIGLVFSFFMLIIGLYVVSKLRRIASESERQSRILYQVAVALKADVPEHLRPREGFVAELKRGYQGK